MLKCMDDTFDFFDDTSPIDELCIDFSKMNRECRRRRELLGRVRPYLAEETLRKLDGDVDDYCEDLVFTAFRRGFLTAIRLGKEMWDRE